MIAQVHTLTPAEFKVFRLLGLGLTNQEIADSLFISPLTVRTHVKKLHAKCDIKGRAKLALTAYQVCYRELREGREERAGTPDHDSGDSAVWHFFAAGFRCAKVRPAPLSNGAEEAMAAVTGASQKPGEMPPAMPLRGIGREAAWQSRPGVARLFSPTMIREQRG